MGEVPENNLMRVFVAIEMPEIVQREIAKIQKTLQALDLFKGTYVEPKVAHLTLRFIGYIEPAALAPIKKILSSIEFSPVEARLGRLGAFGNNNFLKVIWVELISPEIVTLANKIEKGLSLGRSSESRPFHAHVTLARVKSVKDINLLKDELGVILPEPISFTADEFVLKQSSLTPKGPVYVELERYQPTPLVPSDF